jgi:hypothetical protein
VAVVGSGIVSGSLRATDPTAGTTLTIGNPITLCGSERGLDAESAHRADPHLAPTQTLGSGEFYWSEERIG